MLHHVLLMTLMLREVHGSGYSLTFVRLWSRFNIYHQIFMVFDTGIRQMWKITADHIKQTRKWQSLQFPSFLNLWFSVSPSAALCIFFSLADGCVLTNIGVYWPIQVNDDSALSASAKGALFRSYPDARRAHLKTGGNFPYLSRSNEVNLYIQVHCAEVVDDCWECEGFSLPWRGHWRRCCYIFNWLVHGQVTIIFVVSVHLFVCLFVQSFSEPSLIRFRSN